MREQILSGTLRPGESLPSIRKLAGELGISVITSKHAYQDLEQQGLITSMVGRGSFVAELDVDRMRELRVRDMEAQIQALLYVSRTVPLTLDELLTHIRLVAELGKD
jgi:GntR family transcriptional regulator